MWDTDKRFIDYIRSKYKEAVEVLIQGEGDARSRVKDAYNITCAILLEDYPENLRTDVNEIRKLLTRLPGGEEGFIIDYNFKNMKNKTASKAAMMIFNVYLKLEKLTRIN